MHKRLCTILSATMAFNFMMMANAQETRPFCCDATIPSVNPPGKVGIGCTPDGIDCGFAGQVQAQCVRLSPIGASVGTAVGCQ
ncbi:MAG: hypothetical protein J3Q66DRAFT_287290 [Benniella sp.]|nr:MAG: hypothetical protein J3Q66DRAFT_287290 [Benniella sp.]